MNLKDKIELYFSGKLSSNEIEKLKSDIEENPKIKEYFHRREILEEQLKEKYRYETLNAKLPGLEDEPEDMKTDRLTELQIEDDLARFYHHIKLNKVKKQNSRDMNPSGKDTYAASYLLLKIAASIILLLAIGYGVLRMITQRSDPGDYSGLYTEFFAPGKDPFVVSNLPEGLSVKDDFLEVEENYQEYYDFFLNENFRSGEGKDGNVIFLAGLLHMQKGEWEKAENNFQYLILENKTFVDGASYYLALINLNKGNPVSALSQFKKLCGNPSPYSELSCKLLASIPN